MRTLLLVLLILSGAATQAAVYRCETPDRVFFTDLGCADGRVVVLKPPVGSVDALSPAEHARLAEIERDSERRRAFAGQKGRQTRTLKHSRDSAHSPSRAPGTKATGSRAPPQAACTQDPARDQLIRMAQGGHKKSQLRARIRMLKAARDQAAPTCRRSAGPRRPATSH